MAVPATSSVVASGAGGLRVYTVERPWETIINNQMEKSMENDLETGAIGLEQGLKELKLSYV